MPDSLNDTIRGSADETHRSSGKGSKTGTVTSEEMDAYGDWLIRAGEILKRYARHQQRTGPLTFFGANGFENTSKPIVTRYLEAARKALTTHPQYVHSQSLDEFNVPDAD